MAGCRRSIPAISAGLRGARRRVSPSGRTQQGRTAAAISPTQRITRSHAFIKPPLKGSSYACHSVLPLKGCGRTEPGKNSASARRMNRLSFVSDSTFDAERLRRQLAGLLDVRFVELADIHRAKPDRFTVVSANLSNASGLLDLKEWMKSKPKDGKVIFATQPGLAARDDAGLRARRDRCREQPIDAKELLEKLWSDFAVLGGRLVGVRRARSSGRGGGARRLAGDLHRRPASARRWTRSKIGAASAAVVDEIEFEGPVVLDRHRAQAPQPDLSALPAGHGRGRRLRTASRPSRGGSQSALVRRHAARRRQGA